VRKTAIVVPCYNEEKRLNAGEFVSFASREESVSFIFVNDGSLDRTSAALKKLVEANPSRFFLVELERNSGKAEAVRVGFLKAIEKGFDYIGFWDADLATPLSCVTDFISVIDSGKDAVIGSRVRLLGRDIRRRPLRHYLGRLFATAVSVILRLPVYDTQCGAKLFRKTASFETAVSAPFRVKWTFDVELLGRLAVLEQASGRPDVQSSWVEFPLPRWEEVRGSKVRGSDFARSGAELLRLAGFFLTGARRRKYLESLEAYDYNGRRRR